MRWHSFVLYMDRTLSSETQGHTVGTWSKSKLFSPPVLSSPHYLPLEFLLSPPSVCIILPVNLFKATNFRLHRLSERPRFALFALGSLATPFKETQCLSRDKGKGPTITWFLYINALQDRSLHTVLGSDSVNRPLSRWRNLLQLPESFSLLLSLANI